MLIIDPEKCIGCGVCEAQCAFGAIAVVEGAAQVNDKCTLCGSCVDNCEVGALSLEKGEPGDRADLSAWAGVFVYAESRHGQLAQVSLELLGIGRKLADQRRVPLAAVLLGHDLAGQAETLIAHGADTVYRVDDPALASFTDQLYADTLEELIRTQRPEIVLAGATAIGRSFIPKVATSLGAGLTADCTELAIGEDGNLLQTRPAFGGNIMATIVCPDTRPQMATVRSLVMKAVPPDASRQGQIIDLPATVRPGALRVEVLGSVLAEQDKVKLTEAKVVVAAGRGLGDEKGFALIRELAELLGGAVAASRAAVDAGWIDYAHQVGQTGKTVAPKVYLCCGISGAIQHLVGMRSSETIIAINRDPEAPIFEVATYGVVGDLFEILPKLIDHLRRREQCANGRR